MMVIEAAGLSITYGESKAIDNLELQIPPGIVYGIIGPDGAGKTSLIRAFCTLLSHYQGTIKVLGFDAAQQAKTIRAAIGYMPQRFSLYQDLTVQQNIMFFARLFRVTKAEREKRLELLYRFSRLQPFAKRLAGNLSGGMKQKLALSCALIHTPRLLILDEPTFGVDPVSRLEFWQILHELKAEGISIVVSTPYMDEAEKCDLICLLHKGRILQEGTPRQILASWQNHLYSLTGSDLHTLFGFIQTKLPGSELQLFGNEIHLSCEQEIWEEQFRAWQQEFHGLESWNNIAPSMEDVFLAVMKSDTN